MRWLKGLIFIVIALVSLGVVLFWPQGLSKNSNETSKAYIKTETNSLGLPTVWLKQSSIITYDISGERYAVGVKSSTRDIDSTKLLVNLICWAGFLFFVEIGLRGISKRSNR